MQEYYRLKRCRCRVREQSGQIYLRWRSIFKSWPHILINKVIIQRLYDRGASYQIQSRIKFTYIKLEYYWLRRWRVREQWGQVNLRRGSISTSLSHVLIIKRLILVNTWIH